MPQSPWAKAIAECADPQRARHVHTLLQSGPTAAALARADLAQARVLTALWSGSQTAGELLVSHPDWLGAVMDVEGLKFPRMLGGLWREVDAWLRPLLEQQAWDKALGLLRQFKQKELLRIAARDLARQGSVTELTLEISNVADVCLETVYLVCWQQLTHRFGQPWHQDADGGWHPTRFCVLGMGKLGGQELNYSSDVDVLFVYSEEGAVFKEPPKGPGATSKGLQNHQFFKRLAEAIIAEVSRLAPEGALFRIDLRLRPEGNAGPLARSLAGYENYYAQWGQTWERMMLIKARRVAGDRGVAGEFLEMVQTFRFPRSLSEQALKEISGMKRRVEVEVVRAGELDRNVKLGRGGIREVEFVAQTLQILHVGRQPFLADPQTLPTLQKLVRYRLLPAPSAQALTLAYEFLRELEHRLQMDNNLQTHTMPEDPKALTRLARLMGFPSRRPFETALARHRRSVREVYEKLLGQPEEPEPDRLPAGFEGQEDAWRRLFETHRFRDTEKALRLAHHLVQGPGFGHVSSHTKEIARGLLTRLLDLCPPTADAAAALSVPPDGDSTARWLSDPDRVLARLDTFIAAYGARALLFETWTSNPTLFDLLVLLFDRSEFLAESAIRTPDLVDELELSGRLRRSKTAEATLADLRHGLDDADQRLWLCRYHQTELMRIGLRDILGLADFEQNLVELSALAEACLRYALEVVLRKHRIRTAPFAIVGLGKLGGAELNYGSDLDLVFVADNKVKDLPRLQAVAGEVLELLTSPTSLGTSFVVDTRLRPDGEKGLLVNTLQGYEEYYRHRARLWEVQAISRSRFVGGSEVVGQAFRTLVRDLTDFSRTPKSQTKAGGASWKQEIARMRQRIEKERTAPGQDDLAIKTGVGGLMDAEFIAQYFCLAHGELEPNTLRALQLARDRQWLPEPDAGSLISNYRKLRRVEGILRRWSYAGETTLPEDPAPQYRVAVRCGFRTTEAFFAAVRNYRHHLRECYRKVFAEG